MKKTTTDPFFFIITPNNSGSTVFSQFIANNIPLSFLPPHGNNEGQWIPEVVNMMRNNPWSPETKMDWEFIKDTWKTYLNESKKQIFVESSPPTMVRLNSLLKTFRPRGMVLFISNPYLQIASCIHRYSKNESIGVAAKRFTESWLEKAKIQAHNKSLHPSTPLITYEFFCTNPVQACNQALSSIECQDIPSSVNLTIEGKKNTMINTIIDMTPRHLSFLGKEGVSIINEIITSQIDVVEFFGYSALEPTQIDMILAANKPLESVGIKNRAEWDQNN